MVKNQLLKRRILVNQNIAKKRENSNVFCKYDKNEICGLMKRKSDETLPLIDLFSIRLEISSSALSKPDVAFEFDSLVCLCAKSKIMIR